MTAKDNPIIELKNVSKFYGASRGVEDINVVVNKGSIFGFLGPNGSGKSTAINMMLDIIRPSKGEIFLFGKKNTGNTAKLRQKIGYVAGDMELYTHWTGWQYIEFVGKLGGDWSSEKAKKIAQDFEAPLNKKISQLSRGNKQKISLIASLSRETELLILDEPTSGLDPLMQHVFYRYIKQYQKAGGTVFMSSHVLEEVQELCHEVSFIRDGKIIAHRSVNELSQAALKQVVIKADENVLKYILQKNLLPGFVIENGVGSAAVGEHIGQTLKKLPLDKIIDIDISPPKLEDIFLRYYEEEKS